MGADESVAAGPSLQPLVDQIRQASAAGAPLNIVGGNTKSFLARRRDGESVSTAGHTGVVSYDPTEMVITVRAGTTLADVESVLGESGQILGFEPPRLGDASTIGGVISSGLSGPARPYRGRARDFVLGIEMVNGLGEVLRFGGRVMKNVAGYDVSRLVAGASGVLGLISEISIRVVPKPAVEKTLTWQLDADEARAKMRTIASAPWPITAMCADASGLRVRASGSPEAVNDAVHQLQPDRADDDVEYWVQIRNLSLEALQPLPQKPLWRLSVPPASADFGAAAELYDWGGAQRWLRSGAEPETLKQAAIACGGYAQCFHSVEPRSEFLSMPDPALWPLTQRLCRSFDPAGIFNRGHHFPSTVE